MGILLADVGQRNDATVVFVRGNENQSIKATVEDAIRLIAYQKWEAAGKPDLTASVLDRRRTEFLLGE